MEAKRLAKLILHAYAARDKWLADRTTTNFKLMKALESRVKEACSEVLQGEDETPVMRQTETLF